VPQRAATPGGFRARRDQQARRAPGGQDQPPTTAAGRSARPVAISHAPAAANASVITHRSAAPSAARALTVPVIAFMGFTGLVPAEYSSGERTRRGSITKAGSEPVRTALIEAAWAYRHKPAIGATLRRRQHGASPQTLARSWQAQRRLYARYRTMTARGKPAAGHRAGP
jgi:hypothetical protein